MRVRGVMRLRWASVGLLLALVSLWVFSARYEATVASDRAWVSLLAGGVSYGWQDRSLGLGTGMEERPEWNFGFHVPALYFWVRYCTYNGYAGEGRHWGCYPIRGVFISWPDDPGMHGYHGYYPFWLPVGVVAVITLLLFRRTRGLAAERCAANPEFLPVWHAGLLLLFLLAWSAFWYPGTIAAIVTATLLWQARKRAAGARGRNPQLVRLRRISVGVLLGLLFVWVLSIPFFAKVARGRALLDLRWGQVMVGWADDPQESITHIGISQCKRGGWTLPGLRDELSLPYFERDAGSVDSPGAYFAECHLWLPFVITAAITIVLYRRTRGFPAGRCHACGYDLTGNTSGVCPECGITIEAEILKSTG